MNYIAKGSISENPQINALATTYVGLVEAALKEYESARLALEVFWNNHALFSLGPMHQGQQCLGRLEEHRNTVHHSETQLLDEE